MWLYLLNSRIKDYKFEYKVTIGFILFIFVFVSIAIISFRVIEPGFGGIDASAYKSIYNSADKSFGQSLKAQFYEPGYAAVVWFFSSYVGS